MHIIFVYVLTITGNGDKVCSDEVLDSQNVIQSYVPQLTPSKSDSKGDQNHPGAKQHSSKVSSCGISLQQHSMIVRHKFYSKFINYLL